MIAKQCADDSQASRAIQLSRSRGEGGLRRAAGPVFIVAHIMADAIDQAATANTVGMRTRMEMKTRLEDGRPRAPDFRVEAGVDADFVAEAPGRVELPPDGASWMEPSPSTLPNAV